MPDDAVAKALASAKDALASANKFTQGVTGGATDAFAEKKPTSPRIPQAHPAHPSNASYGLVAEARSAAEGIKAKQKNVEEFLKAK